MDILCGCGQLPRLIINFRDVLQVKWHHHERLNATTLDTLLECFNVSDVELLLQPFRRLQHAAALEVRLPIPVDASTSTLIEEMRALCIGSPLPVKESSAHRVLRQRINGISAWLEHLLDNMEGLAAGQLRFEQLGSWSAAHRMATRRRIADGRAGGLLTQSMADILYSALDARRQAAWAFQPLTVGPKIPQPHMEDSMRPVDYWGFGRAELWDGDAYGLLPEYSYWTLSRLPVPLIPRKNSVPYREVIEEAKTRGQGYEGFVATDTGDTVATSE